MSEIREVANWNNRRLRSDARLPFYTSSHCANIGAHRIFSRVGKLEVWALGRSPPAAESMDRDELLFIRSMA